MEWVFPNFSSFSEKKSVAKGFQNDDKTNVMFVIPAGTPFHGINLKQISEFAGEEEILLPAHLRCTITRSKVVDGCLQVYLEPHLK